MAAFFSAVKSGVSPVDFWTMTPYLTRAAIKGLIDGRTLIAWQTAALTRAKKFPKLEELLTKDDKPVDVEAKIKGLLTSIKVKKNGR